MGGTYPVDDPDLFEAFADEMQSVNGRAVIIRLESTPANLVGVLGIMQLALRHPALIDSPAVQNFVAWAREIELALAQYGPATARVCSMGWSPENDEPKPPPSKRRR